MSSSLILPCAGSGSRFGAQPKQLALINDEPVFIHSLRPFLNLVSEIIIPCQPELRPHIEAALQAAVIDARCIDGGRERMHSVYAALQACDARSDSVLIHDAVRPCVRQSEIQPCIAALETHDAALCAIPCSDTLKRSSDSGRHCLETVRRDGLFLAQTPQAFHRQGLLPAYADAVKTGRSFTDDIGLCEDMGLTIAIVPGSRRNIKVTWPDDLAVAAALLADS